jgi:hypothetical protein
MKKLLALILAVVLCASLTLASAESVYVKEFTTEELTSNTFHNGFVTALGAKEVNTLTLNDDGTYVYVKELHQENEDGTVAEATEEAPVLLVTYTFTGAYTQDGDTVVLSFPTNVKFSENWGNLAAMGYFLNSEGEANFADDEITGDNVKCKEEEGHVPFDIFPGPFVVDSLVTSEAGFDAEECTVTITLNGDSFDYVIVNSDDD